MRRIGQMRETRQPIAPAPVLLNVAHNRIGVCTVDDQDARRTSSTIVRL